MIIVRALNFKMVALHFVSVTEEVKIAIEIQFQGVQKMLLSLTYHFSKYMLSFCLLNLNKPVKFKWKLAAYLNKSNQSYCKRMVQHQNKSLAAPEQLY